MGRIMAVVMMATARQTLRRCAARLRHAAEPIAPSDQGSPVSNGHSYGKTAFIASRAWLILDPAPRRRHICEIHQACVEEALRSCFLDRWRPGNGRIQKLKRTRGAPAMQSGYQVLPQHPVNVALPLECKARPHDSRALRRRDSQKRMAAGRLEFLLGQYARRKPLHRSGVESAMVAKGSGRKRSEL